ncbi:hypothetical protein L7F22_015647 [Adiantum nelumboides]|nr:hypothetical protein [Adiantum nelumboides]
MSLELKAHELRLTGQTATLVKLSKSLREAKFVDLFDESDALLHHRYHLIYAVGATGPLDHVESRATVCQSLLRILNQPSDAIGKLLSSSGFAVVSASESPGSFRNIRLSKLMPIFHPVRISLCQVILKELLNDPPYGLEWMKISCNRVPFFRRRFISAVLNADDDVGDFCDELVEDIHRAHLLALRGFLAFGLLEYALELRNRVDYGIDPRRHPKRLAVPFRAADVPSTRSEFSHPDVSIILSILAYYYDGLCREQIKEAFSTLMGLGASAQHRHYQLWLNSVKSNLNAEELNTIDDVTKIDMTNAMQFDLLVVKFSRSIELINFWLNTSVFKTDTAQYQQRIAVSSWNLANSHHAIGFSGTNDTHHLLPLMVEQREPQDQSLLATNGHMLDCILSHTLVYQTVHSEDNEEPIWKTLLLFVTRGKYNALVDTGSLLAGVPNAKAAEFIVDRPNFDERFRGVFYFDSSKANGGQWTVLDRSSRQAISQYESSIKESNAFVLFDDARSRGADMKLPTDAVAVLTLGPKLTKDKMMQGAGRMCLLGKGQKLVVVGSLEIEKNIRLTLAAEQIDLHQDHQISIGNVLYWVMHNTKDATIMGLFQWAQQGLFFYQGSSDKEKMVVDEDWTLGKLYGGGRKRMKLAMVIRDKVGDLGDADGGGRKRMKLAMEIRDKVGDLGDADEMLKEICRRCEQFGGEKEIMIDDCNDECEREMQWKRKKKRRRKLRFQYATEIKHIDVVMKDIFGDKDDSVSKIAWSQCNIFGTKNFFTTIVAENHSEQGGHLRPADVFLIFVEDHSILLLSDKDSDAILQLLWTHSGVVDVQLMNLSLLRSAKWRNLKPALAVGHSKPLMITDLDLTALQLFNGDTAYKGVEAALMQLVSNKLARNAVRGMIELRRQIHNWSCSDIEIFCNTGCLRSDDELPAFGQYLTH